MFGRWFSLFDCVYGVAHSDPLCMFSCSYCPIWWSVCYLLLQKAFLGLHGFWSLSCKTECVTVVWNKEKLWFFFFQSALYCKLLQSPVLFSSGYVRKIPGSEITSFLLSSSIGHAVEVGISDCLRVFNVMVTSKSPKGSLEGGFNVGVRKCQCQCQVLQTHCYCLPNATVHEDFVVYFVTGVWNTVRLPYTKTLSLQSLPNSVGQQARGLSLPLWMLVHAFSSCRDGSLCLFAVQQGEVLVYLHLGSSWAAAVHVGEEWL